MNGNVGNCYVPTFAKSRQKYTDWVDENGAMRRGSVGDAVVVFDVVGVVSYDKYTALGLNYY